MKNFNSINNISGWLVFLIALITYSITLEPSASFWDCGEFIASAYKLEVGHPPGAPLFMLLGRLFSLFSFGDVELVAMWVNMLSASASALTILFLFWTITHLARRILPKNENDKNIIILIIGSGFVGALAYTFSDTFWFSAVEGEVYALSSLFTAFVFWAILKWERVADQPDAGKWIILIAYMMGLSIGVHLLNLLAIPAIVFVYYFRKNAVSIKGVLAASGLSIVFLAAVQYGIVQGLFVVASHFELVFVNSLNLPFYSGLLAFIILLLTILGLGMYFSQYKKNIYINAGFFTLANILLGIPFLAHNSIMAIFFILLIAFTGYFLAKKSREILNLILLCFTVILIGYSTFATIMIRSLANPPMDENNPENVFALLDYLNREQYGDRPLFYGQYYSAEAIEYNQGAPKYYPNKKTGKYEIYDYKTEVEYSPEMQTVFPRMYSSDPNHIEHYKSWANIKGKQVMATVKRINPQTGGVIETQIPLVKPTFSENLSFLFSYQLGHMYFRYFMWNFAGKQNDLQGHGGMHKGNWMSGIPLIDYSRVGTQANMPDYMKNNPGNNNYFLFPFLLGVFGIIWQFSRRRYDGVVVGLLFFFTGIAIVLYLNQYPLQPRERDYAFAGSFYAFSIWIGLGLLMVYSGLVRFLKKKMASIVSVAVCIILVPGIMAFQNWDDHDRSGRYTASHLAKAYLDSCEPNAILFTMGDNDTFPLWYVQEVEGYRTDVRVVNLSLLGMDWYINQMKSKVYESNPVPFSMEHEKYMTGTRDIIMVEDINRLYDAGAFRTKESVKIVMDLNIAKYMGNISLVEKFNEIYSQLISIVEESDLPKINPSDYEKITRGQDSYNPFLIKPFIDILQKEENIKAFGIDAELLKNIFQANTSLIAEIKSEPLSLKLAMDFMQNDDPLTIYPENDNHYLPAQKLSIPINKKKILEKQIVPLKDSSKIVDNLVFTIPDRYLQKNFMMVLDLLANFNWDRPVYFALTIGSENFLNLHSYLHLEGLAFRLLPIKSDVPASIMKQTHKTGSINTDIMYRNIMEKWQFGGMNKPGVYMDENNRSMMMNMKTNFSRLAEALIKEGKIEKAKMVLDKADAEFPINKTGYSFFDFGLLKSRYLIGDFVKGKEVLDKIVAQLMEERKYYLSFDNYFKEAVNGKIEGIDDLLDIANSFEVLFGMEAPQDFKSSGNESNSERALITLKNSLYYNNLLHFEQQEIINFLNVLKATKDILEGLSDELKIMFGTKNIKPEKWLQEAPEEKLKLFREYIINSLEDDSDKKRIADLFDRILASRTNAPETNHLNWFISLDEYSAAMLVEFIIININV